MPVAISLLFWRFEEISLVLVILGSAAFGALCVFLLGMVKQVSQSFKIK
ncbi:MAG: LapA family protein, partial [Clostridia bacterium]|nr:LapA family protein [Clostridia bacterium]